ncbi:hypothetical protein T265_02938 [Opisthorchis viverrini]|uniref:ATP-binding cassette transporter n=1 Tax=Opisthorchis viverrini TaxID=6198 RepID=A0A074ZUD2_OPIVI|nr:hypothetical protein T265_02938 [Opisthorchis viverrini]KER30701.1 hypothetical protein T265_02938 [Opisthorchis viverrini]
MSREDASPLHLPTPFSCAQLSIPLDQHVTRGSNPAFSVNRIQHTTTNNPHKKSGGGPTYSLLVLSVLVRSRCGFAHGLTPTTTAIWVGFSNRAFGSGPQSSYLYLGVLTAYQPTTVCFLESWRQIPPGRHHNSTRRIIRRQVKLSVRADREAWWTRKVEEMEDAKNAGNVRKLFQLIRSTGPRKPLVSETIRDQNGSLICSKAELGNLKEEDKGHQMKIGYVADEPMEERAMQLTRLSLRFLSASCVPKQGSSIHKLQQISLAQEYRADLTRKLVAAAKAIPATSDCDDARRSF